MDKELAKGESAVDNIKRRLSGGRKISSDVPRGLALVCLTEHFLSWPRLHPACNTYKAGDDHASRSRATKKGRAESSEERESLTLPKADVRQAFQPASGRHLLG